MRNRVIGGLTLAAAGMLALAACSSGGSSTASSSGGSSSVKSGGTLTFALDQDMAGFNVNSASDEEFVLQEVLNQTLPQVYVIQPDLKPVLDTDYVTSVKVTSTSPQTIVYQINPKAVWSDGVPINADDFIYNWEAQSGNPKFKDVGGQAYEPATTAGYANIKSVTGSNGGKTVTMIYSKPFGDWKALFTDIYPAHIMSKVGFNSGFQTFNSAVKVSGGPFELQSYTKGQDIIEVPNPTWWGAKPKLSKLVFQIFADDNQIPPAIQNNEVNAANPAQASVQFKDAVASVPNTSTTIIPGLEFQHIDFNEANFYLADANVRHAIAYGTDREEMVQRIVSPITTSVKPLMNRIYMPIQPQYQDTSAGYGDFNPSKAKSLLAAAGMTMGSDGYFQPKSGPEAGKDLSFTISTTSGEPVRAEIEQLFQANMKDIGVKINIQNYSPNTLFGTVAPKSEYDIIEFAWVSTPFASANLSIYCDFKDASNCGQNWNHYEDPQVDSLLNQAGADENPTTAAAMYNQADALLWRDMDTLPLFEQPQLYTYGSQFANVIPNPSSIGLTWNANQWGVKAS